MIGYILLLLVIAGLIRIPAIQLKMANYATSYVSDKTHTKVEIKKINIYFPKSVVLEGLYLEDLLKDTLIYAGQAKMDISIKSLLKSNIDINYLAFKDVVIHINRSEKDSLFNYNFLLKAFSGTTKQKKPTKSWTFNVDDASMKNIRLHFNDQYGGMNVTANLKQFRIKGASLDFEKQLVQSDLIALSESGVQYSKKEPVPSKTVVDGTNTATTENHWKVSVKRIDLKENKLSYHIENKPEIKNSFDVFHLTYRQVTLKASNLLYAPDLTKISIEKFTAVDQNGFAITKFETDFKMDSHAITAKKIKVRTSNSSLKADLILKYTSLKSLIDSIQSVGLQANIKELSINNLDILYFSPLLSKQSFFKNRNTNTTASGKISGTLNHLKGENLKIQTGSNTSLKTDFSITGLPDFKTALFHFPNLRIRSGRKDIAMMTGHSLPQSVELPENISVQIIFNGAIKSFSTTMDMSSSFGSAHLVAAIDKKENFSGKMNFTHFDLGRLLKDRVMYGPATLTAEANGQGLDMKTIQAKIKAEVSQIYLNQYNYHNLKIDGKVAGREFEGKINLNDSNAVFDFDGLVNLNAQKEYYKFHLNLKGANLQKLHFTKTDTRIGLMAVADLKGSTLNRINGKVRIDHIMITHEGQKYRLDSFLITSINEPQKSELKMNSALVDVKYSGNLFPTALSAELTAFINSYFSTSKQAIQKKAKKSQNIKTGSQHFNFEIQLHNHPIISEVLLPQLKEFVPGLIQGSYDSQKRALKLTASMPKIVYGTTVINDFAVDVNSDPSALNYQLSCSSVLNNQIKFDNLLVEGKLADQHLFANISSIDNRKNKKLLVRSQILMDKGNYKIMLDPKDFYLMNDRWDIAADNYIKVGKQGFLIHHFNLNKAESQIHINSVHEQFKDDLSIGIKNFKLDDISRIIEKDTSFLKGKVNGNVLLKNVNNSYGIIADVQINDLFVRQVPIGNLSLKAENTATGRFDIDMNLSGADNNLSANGYSIPNGNSHSINIKAAIQSLSMQTVKAFSFGQLTEASGSLSGHFSMVGSTSAPEVNGEMIFNNAFITPAMLNNRLELKHETVQIKNDGIYFNSFTLLDAQQHSAQIDGAVQMKNFKDFIFNLHVSSKDFLLFNTKAKDNKEYYGKMVLDSKIDISGPMTFPVVNARIKMKKGSYFTFAVPENKLTADKGEGIVEFEDTLIQNSILDEEAKKEAEKSTFTGFDLSSVIEIDKQATLRLLIDPASSDSLVVRGEAALSFSIDRSGKMSLTGTYNLDEGSYLVSLESVIKRKFDIESGSTITWNGDPMDAAISINAIYTVRTSPSNLIEGTDLSDADANAYKQRYPFLVYLKLRGEILKPEISFEIKLPPEEKGILNGAVNAKLILLNEDPSALNKQVFALLVLGRFIQENPLQTETNGVSSAARATVGKLLSAQLNQWSSKIVSGVELNFDVQSYDEYQSGQAQGRTQVDIGLKKQLFNDRLSILVGGIVDVEGEKAKQNSTSDITSDFTLEYKITKDGRYRLKGFRQNQYEGAIEGQLIETGVGIQYVRDFNKWKYFFRAPKVRGESSKKK
ncbi:MAG: translocation/assembly module TamB domain-containing protein [Bacteroidales bacterium]|nr:translocation/assembly module TamB domain-containing protein [Bacteroidales bacterium]